MEKHILSSCESIIFMLTGIPLPSLNILKNYPLHSGSSKVLSICRVVNSITRLLFLRDIMAVILLSPLIHSSLARRFNILTHCCHVIQHWVGPHWHWTWSCDLLWPMGYGQKKYTTCSKTLRAFPWLALLFSLCSFSLRPRMRRDV